MERAVPSLASGAGRCALVAAFAFLPGCHARVEAPHAPSAMLPPLVVATAKTTLRATDDPRIRLATPRATLPLRVSELRGNDAWVELGGGIEVAGSVPFETLGVRVCEAGPIDGGWYLGKGNTLTLRSTVRNGVVRVAGTVAIRAKAYEEKMPFAEQFRELTFETDLPVARLCSAPPPKRHAGTAKDPEILTPWGEPNAEDFPSDARAVWLEKEAAHALLDAPSGSARHTLPAERWEKKVIRLRREGAWDLVAAGGGPYLLGWIPARGPEGGDGDPVADVFGVGGLGLSGAFGAFGGHAPLSLLGARYRGWAIHRLAAGTVIQQLGKPRARLTRDGYARVSPKANGTWSYVVAAVDDEVTAEGWVETAKLGERGSE